ncbi:MAG: hypothetical protein K2X87_12840 [Gemmataceae bacterium]|nr:hypothetical protein [Gemmataceae bacterium]
MPRDDDEDPSAPLDLGPEPARPVYPAPAAPPAAAPKAPAVLRWGVCGVYHTAGELAGFPGEDGVIRYVTSGVTYTAPPLPAGWRSVPSEPGRYELPWPGDPAAARTLRHLRTDLERAARSGVLSDPHHPLLVELDTVGVGLADLAGKLHRQRWGLGLVQPDNVVVRGREVVPVDLGFTWKGAFGNPPWDDSPGRPDWLDPAGPAAALWDHPPARQQFADPANGVFPPADPGSDVRTIGRLLAWLISGQTGMVLPDVGGPDGPPPAWATVADAAAGRIPSADALAARLRQNPLSEYFAPPPLADDPAPRTATGGTNWLTPAALAAVLLMAAAGGGYYYLTGGKTGPTGEGGNTTGNGEVGSGGPGDPAGFEAAAGEFDKAAAAKDRPGMWAALRKLLAAAPPEKQAEADARRAKALDEWVVVLNETVTIAGDPTRRLDAGERFAALDAELKQLTEARPATDPAQREKEQQCLAVVAEYARQFGPPRPPSP